MRDVLEVLTGDEALSVLRALLVAHPALVEEAQQTALRGLRTADRREVARAVVQAVDALGLEDMAARTGREVHGYVHPVEAAWDVLEETIAPFAAEVDRRLSIGLEEPARAWLEGLLVGLHELHVDASSHELLQYAPDFPLEAACAALEQWARAGGGPPGLSEELLHEELYEWVGELQQTARRARRT